MLDLSEKVGLPVRLVQSEGGWQLQLNEPLRHEPPQGRRIGDMKAVLKNPAADTPPTLYWMYRDVRLPEHEKHIAASGLRYDLTLFNPGVLSVGGVPQDGDEWNKAAGHYHPYTATGVTFPEVYEVVHGRGLFLLQFVDDIFAIPPKVTRFVIVEVQAGDVVVIPPNCAHPTIVLGDEPLVTANWVARAFDSQYTPIKLMRGVAYYIVKRGDGYAVERNPAYPDAPTPEFVRASALDPRGVPTDEPTYHAFLRSPDAFAFLVRPKG
ncbi:Glucose-6-phosphate isomerase [bacterium HR17]|uniref:glucose-6-phosphate isomerase n=1 Tax=Candidatus Fervidibacter japonicus TaxID=2035412 RepID=A0A2H5XCM9_9BACT|nr:Glucose-6-phosphate isomerase [bacterium HR17]